MKGATDMASGSSSDPIEGELHSNHFPPIRSCLSAFGFRTTRVMGDNNSFAASQGL